MCLGRFLWPLFVAGPSNSFGCCGLLKEKKKRVQIKNPGTPPLLSFEVFGGHSPRARILSAHVRCKVTSHFEHDECIRFSPKSSESCPPVTVIQRSKHCQTRVLGQNQARIGAHELLRIRGTQTLDQARRHLRLQCRQ